MAVMEVPTALPASQLLNRGTLDALCATALAPMRVRPGNEFERCVQRVRRTVQEDYAVLCADLGIVSG
jgi:hypothetical protein